MLMIMNIVVLCYGYRYYCERKITGYGCVVNQRNKNLTNYKG